MATVPGESLFVIESATHSESQLCAVRNLRVSCVGQAAPASSGGQSPPYLAVDGVRHASKTRSQRRSEKERQIL